MRTFLLITLAFCTVDAQIVRRSVNPHGEIEPAALTQENAEESIGSDLLAEVQDLVLRNDPESRDRIKVIMDLVESVFPVVKQEKQDEEARVALNIQSIGRCNEQSKKDQQAIKESTETPVGSTRGTHAECREEEKNKESHKNGRCGELDTFLAGLKAGSAKPTTGRDAKVKWVEDLSTYWCPQGPEAEKLDEACKTAEKEHAEHKADCDLKQRTFEAAFCTWRTELVDECMDLATCYDSAVKAYTEHKALAEKLVEKWKVEWKSLKKIRCYVDVWMNDNNVNTVDADQYSKCKTLDPDTTEMEIDFGTVPAKETCDLEPVKTHPGTQEFPNVEYSKFSKYADEPLACSGKVTVEPTTTTQAEVTTTTQAPVTTTTQAPVTTTTQPKCTEATKPTNLVNNGGFSGSIAPWTCFNKPGDYVKNGCHLHHNFWGHDSTGHLHGHCHEGTAGGFQQEVSTSAGVLYKLKFNAFEGDWDGDDHDSVHVKVENSDKSSWTTFTIHSGTSNSEWKALTLDFTASGPSKIIFWADGHHCIDIDDVQLLSC